MLGGKIAPEPQTMRVLSGLALDRATHKKRDAKSLSGTRRRWAIKTNPRTARGH
jgi:hypothetical protein